MIKLKDLIGEELYNSQGETYTFGKGDIVKDINPDCPHHGAEGEVIKGGKVKITFKVTNNGKNYKEGDELEKTVDQMVKLKSDEITEGKLSEKFTTRPPSFSSREAKNVVDGALRNYSKDLKKLQHRVIRDWMSKAKSGVIDYFDLVRGFQSGDASRAYPYETEFLMSVLSKDKIIDRFRKYFGGKKGKPRR